ncbi:putative serine/threonine-protein phosphatase 6 regulatory ankyrin repeat subunit A-like [Penaeus vannamei]|uniref:Putative serine/threonine-protein phosphatase 6 regulatory ankyrin repeat subunit A-like n=1 Tax=Penaeus vannamei TaxID=6689 RepID=A0A3R7NAI8_PENVA|nr:putative serine/threonine-protein phosphatase 6 regulatory ankyrin repeat subunit A-like [Penaeus vannamei]
MAAQALTRPRGAPESESLTAEQQASSRYDWPGRPREDDLSRPSRLSCSLGDEGGEGAWPEDLRGGGGSFRQDREAAARRCRRRPRRIVKMLILGGDVNGKNEKGATPLHRAAYKGHTSVVTALVTRGATVNEIANLGFTPLHCAAHQGHEAAAEELIVKGADVNAKKMNGPSLQYGPPLTAPFPCSWTWPERATPRPCRRPRLLAPRATKDFFAEKPLHVAAEEGHDEVAKMLVSMGANVNDKNDEGCTPLHVAAEEGHEAMVQELAVRGADANAKDDAGYTPLHLAAQEGQVSAIEELIAKGAEADAKDDAGYTPLHLAAQEGRGGGGDARRQRRPSERGGERGNPFYGTVTEPQILV